ncbi:MAG: hypothetical protein R3D67_16890 [Hyphomicrobiaceae bacterium]
MIDRMELVDSSKWPVRCAAWLPWATARPGGGRSRGRIGNPEGVDPPDLGVEADDLAEGTEDADHERQQQPVKSGIVPKGGEKLLSDDRDQEADENNEDDHAAQKATGRVQRTSQTPDRAFRASTFRHPERASAIPPEPTWMPIMAKLTVR